MRTLKLIALGIILFASSTTHAQVSVNLNIGTAPSWGPVGHVETEYYYLPDIEVYYDIRASQFIYFGRGKWIRSRNLPNHYRNYNLYNGYKVVLNDYHGSRPYNHFKSHKIKYYKGYKGKPQRTIGIRKTVVPEKSYNNGNDKGNKKYEKENKGHGKDKN